MSAVRRGLFVMATMLFVVFFSLSAIQPRQYLFLCVPLSGRSYFTIDNKPGQWNFRIGHMGGIDGFELSLNDTDPQWRELRDNIDPNLVCVYFVLSRQSPFFLLQVPPYAPAGLLVVVFGFILIAKLRNVQKSAIAAQPDVVEGTDNARET